MISGEEAKSVTETILEKKVYVGEDYSKKNEKAKGREGQMQKKGHKVRHPRTHRSEEKCCRKV